MKKNTYLSQKIFDRIRLLFSDNEDRLSTATVLLANAYGLSRDLTRTSELRMEMSQSKLKKVLGRSSTIVDGKLVVRKISRFETTKKDIFQAFLCK